MFTKTLLYFDRQISRKNSHRRITECKAAKFSAEIMNNNWIHLRDDTGTAAGKNNDLVITSKDLAKVGSVVTIKDLM